jgi:hypothetical protein
MLQELRTWRELLVPDFLVQLQVRTSGLMCHLLPEPCNQVGRDYIRCRLLQSLTTGRFYPTWLFIFLLHGFRLRPKRKLLSNSTTVLFFCLHDQPILHKASSYSNRTPGPPKTRTPTTSIKHARHRNFLLSPLGNNDFFSTLIAQSQVQRG